MYCFEFSLLPVTLTIRMQPLPGQVYEINSQRASHETPGHTLVSALMSHCASLHVLVIIHSISSLFVSVALKLIFYY